MDNVDRKILEAIHNASPKLFVSPIKVNEVLKLDLTQLGDRLMFLKKSEHVDIITSEYPSSLWIVTNGPKPTMVYSKGDNFAFPVKKTNGNFPVGCGDAFAAGYCAADLLGWELDKAIQFGHKLANRVLNHVGCQISRMDAKNIFENFSYECR
jgi:sugar/nucleoside kinase (ribokinase family)